MRDNNKISQKRLFQNSSIQDNEWTGRRRAYPGNLQNKLRSKLSPLPASSALTASVHTAKAALGFVVTVTLYSRRQYFDGAIFHDKDVTSEPRAWFAGYQRACELADGRRVYIAQEAREEGRRNKAA